MTTRERIVVTARALEGALYRWGGNKLEDGGLDCSGYAQLVLARAGVEPWASQYPSRLDLTAELLRQRLPATMTPQPGDLAFYGASTAGHVVVVTAVEGGRVEVTGSSRGYRDLTDPEEARRRRAWVARHDSHLYRRDFMGFGAVPA